jgi:hypothetical protein
LLILKTKDISQNNKDFEIRNQRLNSSTLTSRWRRF